MDIDNGLGLGIVLFFLLLGLCMFTLFICNLNCVRGYCKKEDKNSNEYRQV